MMDWVSGLRQADQMTWEDLQTLLYAERGKLDEQKTFGQAVSQNEFDEACLELMCATLEELNTACEEFARSGQWPELTEAGKLMLWFRLEVAIDFCSGMEAAGWALPFLAKPIPEEVNRATMLRFLLVRLWQHDGEARIHNMLEFLQRADVPQKPADDLLKN